jgi:hypothetical protein
VIDTSKFAHIKDEYFRNKLEQGLIEYKPEDWVVLEDEELEG